MFYFKLLRILPPPRAGPRVGVCEAVRCEMMEDVRGIIQRQVGFQRP